MVATTSNRKRWYFAWAAMAVFLAFFAVLAYAGWKIVGSNLGVAGASPGLAVAGELASPRMRQMEQRCTGVVKTSTDVWLVGRNEIRSSHDRDFSHIPTDAVRLGGGDDISPLPRGHFGRSGNLTTLARLQEDGSFKVVATVPDVACMTVTPESEILYLSTWLPRPRGHASNTLQDGTRIQQSMIFRSDDRGQSWQWLEAGFMAQDVPYGSSLKPVFASDQEAWAWGEVDTRGSFSLWPSEPAPTTAPGNDGALVATALLYSPDAGRTTVRIRSPQPLEVTNEELLSLNGMPQDSILRRPGGDPERFVVQIDERQAYAWVSETAWHPDEHGLSMRVAVTSRAKLTRPDAGAAWQVATVERQPNLYLVHLATSFDRQTHAVLGNDQGQWLARLDDDTGEWVDHQSLPTLLPEWLAGSEMGVRYFWSNGSYQVVSLWGDVIVPRLLFPFSDKPAEILADAHFYTSDGGRSWRQLAIPGYLGVMGLAHHDDELFWTKGNWYTNDEPYVWRYGLAQ